MLFNREIKERLTCPSMMSCRRKTTSSERSPLITPLSLVHKNTVPYCSTYVRDGSMDAECERAFPLVFGLADYYQNTVQGNVLSGE
jgi:hypothetical protein